MCLNPCFNGRWSARSIMFQERHQTYSRLNPCFNGRWSARMRTTIVKENPANVLILVLMEDGLRAFIKTITTLINDKS